MDNLVDIQVVDIRDFSNKIGGHSVTIFREENFTSTMFFSSEKIKEYIDSGVLRKATDAETAMFLLEGKYRDVDCLYISKKDFFN